MISDLTPASQRSPFHTSTINLAGMLFCLFLTLSVIQSVSHDQSGATLLELTTAFNGSLRDQGRQDVAVIAAAFHRAALAPDDKLADMDRIGGTAPRKKQNTDGSLATFREEATGVFSAKKSLPVDVNGPVFSHLMTELNRYFNVSRSEELGGQLGLDLHSQVAQSEDFVRNTIEKILETCQIANVTVHAVPAEFEIIVWASSPASDDLAIAAEGAFAIEESLQKSLKAYTGDSIRLSSSGRIWTRPNRLRPLATVVIRSAKR